MFFFYYTLVVISSRSVGQQESMYTLATTEIQVLTWKTSLIMSPCFNDDLRSGRCFDDDQKDWIECNKYSI
jgi:hypothetical protein